MVFRTTFLPGLLALPLVLLAAACSDDAPTAPVGPGAGGAGGAAGAAGAAACDPATFAPACDGDRPVACDGATGAVWLGSPCVGAEVCRVGTLRAACAPADAGPCEPGSFEASCEGDGSVRDCDPFDGLTRVRPCGDGRCKSHESGGVACWTFDHADCDRASTPPACEGDERVACNAYGVLERSACPEGRSCEAFPGGGYCVNPGTVACTAGSTPQGCFDATHSYGGCVLPAGLASPIACQPGWVCVEDDPCITSGGSCPQGTCVDPAWPPCEEPAAGGCAGGDLSECVGGHLRVTPCEDGAGCVADGQAALCLPDDQPLCDPGQPEVGCEGADGVVCFGDPRRELRFPCGPGLTCALVDGQPSCVP